MSSSSSQSNNVHFFKIIDKRNLSDGELKVPTSFAKMHWEGMSNPVTLRLPNTTEWKVRWKKHEGDIWLCNGLKEFAKEVSLSEFQFLVFQYQDNSCFNVIVFAKNGSEIKYSVKETREEPEEVEESDYSVEILDEPPPPSLPAKRSNSPPQSSQPHKKRKTKPRDQKENHISKQQSSQHHHKKKKIRNGKKKVEEHSNFDNAAKHMNSGSSSKDLQKRMKAFHEGVKRDFYSEKEFFTCSIKKSYLERNLLVIPNEFSKPHLSNMNGRSATLFVVDDQNRTWEWDVKLRLYNHQMNFIGGWKKFLIDNNLDIGDVCAFVLNKTKGLSFQVFNHSFKKNIRSPLSEVNPKTYASADSSNDKERIKKIHEQVKRRFRSKTDFFTCVMHKTYVNTDNLALPNEFSKQHLHKMDGRSVTLFDVGKTKTWNVRLKKLQRQFTFTSGWIKFSRDNSLKVGDVCAFVSSKSKELSFQVFPFRFEKDIIIPHFEDQEEIFNRPSSSLSPHRKASSPKVGSKCISDEKKFLVYINKCPSQMTISIKYLKNFISESGKIVTLRVRENSWPVKVLLYEYERQSHAKFSQGWSKFIRDCQLKEGDSCFFKMVDEEKLEFEVTINFKS